MKNFKHYALGMATIVAMFAIFAACGDNGNDLTGTPTAPPTEVATTAAATTPAGTQPAGTKTPPPKADLSPLITELATVIEDGKYNSVDDVLIKYGVDKDDAVELRDAVKAIAKNKSIDSDSALSDLAEELRGALDGADLDEVVETVMETISDFDTNDYVLNIDTGKDGATPTPPATANKTATPATDNIDTRASVVKAPQGAGGNDLESGKTPVYEAGKYRDPRQFVECTKTFSGVAQLTDGFLCEPGVLLTNTATFTRPEVDAVHHSNCPEGGFWYGSMHHGTVNVNGVGLNLADYGTGTNHLLVIRCHLSDGKRDSDLNTTMDVGNFVIGHAIWSPIMPNHADGSAYVSMEWFGEQLITSFTTGGSNCGSDGCSTIYVNVYDVDSQMWMEFRVTNIVGESGDSDGDGIVDYASGDWELVSSNR